MSLMRRARGDVDWPEWFPRRLFEWPEAWREVADLEPLRVEEFQEGGDLVVRAEMPGIDPEKDVEITVTDRTLHIKAERRQETKTEDKKGYRTEFRYGSFTRSVPLPVGATEDDVKASYTDGILQIRIPVNAEQAAARKIPIARS